jgi:hypothetical protein
MISGLIDACLGGLLLLAAGEAGGQDLDALLQSLAREPPQAIEFVETHVSPLLEHELVVSGVLEYGGRERLSRVVTEPYRERIDINGTDVRVQREGRPERRFSLRRSRELGGMLSAFSALLSGDRAALMSEFEVTAEISAEGWDLNLVPRQRGAQDHVAKILVHGEGGTPACIAVLGSDGNAATVIRLGAGAKDAAHEDPDSCRGPAREN